MCVCVCIFLPTRKHTYLLVSGLIDVHLSGVYCSLCMCACVYVCVMFVLHVCVHHVVSWTCMCVCVCLCTLACIPEVWTIGV